MSHDHHGPGVPDPQDGDGKLARCLSTPLAAPPGRRRRLRRPPVTGFRRPSGAGRAGGRRVKLMMHREARGQGLDRRLLAVAERAAVAAGVTLLHLDTETDSPAERLYRTAGWTVAGVIPDYAANPSGALRPTTLHYKYVGARAESLASPLTR
ncbi:GNAT family N-acetyltransferase [Streptomyces cellulosae]|uniref:GNAT family N-acetyltransferase n=1 Tax=Streptomyces cellulosae TaxID=1968 RepID=UPI000AF561B5|nr:GNAT family N-acetyltransferase [Streptomyces cellulosae]